MSAIRARNVLYVDYYSFLGGGQVVLLSIFKTMDRQKYRPLLALSSEGPFADRARALGVPVFIIPMGKARWRRFWEARSTFSRLKMLMREQKIDLVHANCYPANKLAGPAAKRLGIGCLWHKHIGVSQKPGSSTGWLWNFFSGYDSRILAVSRQGYEALGTLGVSQEKLRLFYNSADLPRLAKARPLGPKALRSFGLDTKRPFVLAAGMRRRQKGFDVLLKAFSKTKGDFQLALLGDPANSEEGHESLLKDLQNLPGLKGRLCVLPAQPDLAPWMKSAALLVSSSRMEGSPLVVIEAMACGKAIVATKEGSGEILESGKTAWLCAAEDENGLAEAIQLAMQSRVERKKRGLAAKRVAEKRFSLKNYVRELMGLYDEMLFEAKA